MIKRIIIHESLIDSFKNEAVKCLPWEYIVAVLGKMVRDDLHVYAFDKLEITSWFNGQRKNMLSYWQPEEEIEAGTGLQYFGTLHSHPHGTLEPSEDDKIDFRKRYNEGEYTDHGYIGEQLCDEIMGIMRIEKKCRIIQYGIAFYNIDLEPIEVLIGEKRKSKRNKEKNGNSRKNAGCHE